MEFLWRKIMDRNLLFWYADHNLLGIESLWMSIFFWSYGSYKKLKISILCLNSKTRTDLEQVGQLVPARKLEMFSFNLCFFYQSVIFSSIFGLNFTSCFIILSWIPFFLYLFKLFQKSLMDKVKLGLGFIYGFKFRIYVSIVVRSYSTKILDSPET